MLPTTQTVHYILAQKKGVVNPLLHMRLLSGEDVTVLEITGHVVVTNEPLKFVLVYTISRTIAEAIDKRIQTRFGGVGLPTTIEDLQEVITYSGNVVAVQVYFRLTIFLTVGNTGVGIVPVDVVMNSVAHLLFDLTHESRVLFELCIQYMIQGRLQPTLCHYVDCLPAVDLFCHGRVSVGHMYHTGIFQQVWVILFTFVDKFSDRVIIKVSVQTIINELIHCLVIHTINDGFDECILQLIAIDDVIRHEVICVDDLLLHRSI